MRLFIGMPVPPDPAYAALAADLPAGARAVRPGSWHVTLRFLGDVASAEPVMAALEPALAGLAAVPARIAGVGAFPDDRRARVAWVGVEAPGLAEVARRGVAATASFGKPPDRRDFRPHVTLARMRQPADVRAWRERHRGFGLGETVLDRVVLYRSVPAPGGSTHEPLREFLLRPATTAQPRQAPDGP